MQRVRARLASLGVLTTALFAATIALPGPALYQHHHRDGDRAHVHDDGEGLFAELLEHHHHHDGLDHEHGSLSPHRHPDTALGSDQAARAALQRDDEPAGTHWHEQQRFHRAVLAAIPFVVTVTPAGTAPQQKPALQARVVALDLHARAPPLPALS